MSSMGNEVEVSADNETALLRGYATEYLGVATPASALGSPAHRGSDPRNQRTGNARAGRPHGPRRGSHMRIASGSAPMTLSPKSVWAVHV